MHMADALLSPAVGGCMWAATAGTIFYASHRLKQDFDDHRIPLMGVLGSFVFAAQMINFTIPATGSSGHLGGGLILAVLLGPWAAFLTMASVLIVQALFFADGGLLALGCNIFNLGIFPCFIAYPLIFRPLVGNRPTSGRILAGSLVAAVVGLQFGAAGVVLETWLSGISELPFTTFTLLMLPIHLAIGIVEGLVTAVVIGYVWKIRPEMLVASDHQYPLQGVSLRRVLLGLGGGAILIGGIFSWFASAHPDGLEWAMEQVSGSEELKTPEGGIYDSLAGIQEKTAFLPDYGFPSKTPETLEAPKKSAESAWPEVDSGTSFSGLVGGLLTLLLVVTIGRLIRKRPSSTGSSIPLR